MIRDAAHCVGNNGKPLPGVVPVAIQQGRHVAHVIDQDFAPALTVTIHLCRLRTLATIGRAQAIAQIRSIHASGLFA